MTTKKKTADAAQVQEQTAAVEEAAVIDEMKETAVPEEEAHDEKTQTETCKVQETSAASEKDVEAPALESLSVLADRYRVAAWQQAALCRFMGWADGKMLTDNEYMNALAKLSVRHLGGGRSK